MGAKSLPWALSTKREDAQGSDLSPFFGDLSQSEKIYEIEPHLASTRKKDQVAYAYLWPMEFVPRSTISRDWGTIP